MFVFLLTFCYEWLLQLNVINNIGNAISQCKNETYSWQLEDLECKIITLNASWQKIILQNITSYIFSSISFITALKFSSHKNSTQGFTSTNVYFFKIMILESHCNTKRYANEMDNFGFSFKHPSQLKFYLLHNVVSLS